jgi:hypothetical protein
VVSLFGEVIPAGLVAGALLAGGVAAGGQQEASPLAPFGWFAELAGACWTGSLDGKPTDTQCYEVELGRFIKGTITIGAGGERAGQAPAFRGAAIFAWNATANRIDYWQWASDGSYRMADATIENGRLHFPMPRRDATAAAERTTWTRVDRDSFIVVRERQAGSSWTPVLTVTYRRR